MSKSVKRVQNYLIEINSDRLSLIEDINRPSKNIDEGIVVGDMLGFISDVNQVIVDMYGAKSKNEFVGKHIVEFLDSENKQRAIENSAATIVSGQPQTHVYATRAKNGTVVSLAVTTDLVRNEQGRKIGFIDVVRIIG